MRAHFYGQGGKDLGSSLPAEVIDGCLYYDLSPYTSHGAAHVDLEHDQYRSNRIPVRSFLMQYASNSARLGLRPPADETSIISSGATVVSGLIPALNNCCVCQTNPRYISLTPVAHAHFLSTQFTIGLVFYVFVSRFFQTQVDDSGGDDDDCRMEGNRPKDSEHNISNVSIYMSMSSLCMYIEQVVYRSNAVELTLPPRLDSRLRRVAVNPSPQPYVIVLLYG